MKVQVTILTFHALDTAGSVISYPPALFARLVQSLLTHGPPVISLMEGVSGLRGQAQIPEKSVVITFDDGFRSVYEVAFPLLCEHGLPATVFLAVGDAEGVADKLSADAGARLPLMEGRRMLSWGEIREMHRAGFDFGAHTLSHPDLTCLPASDAEREMAASKRVLEDALGDSAKSFAYPFGLHDRQSLALARQHFDCACSDRLGFATPDSDVYALPRVDAYYMRQRWLAGALAKPWFPSYVRARAVPRRLRRRALALLR